MLAFGLLLFHWRSSTAAVYQCCRPLEPSNAPFYSQCSPKEFWQTALHPRSRIGINNRDYFVGHFDSFTSFFNVSILTHSRSRKSALISNVSCSNGGQWQAMNINCPIGFIGHVVALPDRAMSPRPAMDWNGLDAPSAFLINTTQSTTLMKKCKVYGGLLVFLCASLFLQHYHS